MKNARNMREAIVTVVLAARGGPPEPGAATLRHGGSDCLRAPCYLATLRASTNIAGVRTPSPARSLSKAANAASGGRLRMGSNHRARHRAPVVPQLVVQRVQVHPERVAGLEPQGEGG
jgi:hypothetical protein